MCLLNVLSIRHFLDKNIRRKIWQRRPEGDKQNLLGH